MKCGHSSQPLLPSPTPRHHVRLSPTSPVRHRHPRHFRLGTIRRPGTSVRAPLLDFNYHNTFALAQFKDSFRWSASHDVGADLHAYFNFGQFAVKFPSHEPYDRSSRVNGWFTLKLALKKTMLDLLRVGAHKRGPMLALLQLTCPRARQCTRSLGVAPERGRFNFVIRCCTRANPFFEGVLTRNKGETMPVCTATIWTHRNYASFLLRPRFKSSHLQTLTIVQQLWNHFNKAKRSKLKKTRPTSPESIRRFPNPPECTSAADFIWRPNLAQIQPPICRPVFGPPPTVSVLARIRNCTPPRSLPPCDAIRSVQLAPTWRARVPTPDPAASPARVFLRVRRPGASGTSPRASNGPRIPGAREAGDEDERGGERLPAHHSRQDLELPTHGAPAPQRVDSLPPRAPHATRSTPSPRHERLSNAAQFWPRAPESASARALPPAPSARPPRSNGCGRVQAGAPAPVLNAAGLYSSAASRRLGERGRAARALIRWAGARLYDGKRGRAAARRRESGGSAAAVETVDFAERATWRRESSGTLARHRVAAADTDLAGRATQEAHRRTQEAHRRATAIATAGALCVQLGLGRRHAAARTWPWRAGGRRAREVAGLA
ncbi:hypothetical protein B0H15DRAFT_955656 [Mycena belliarum]|uniref:Uncharacterized protein n=1 Tax=Mycena belliarum TaxID=1033014 RepID=A0AAD6TQZ9_9AGAR|nr:hypothetical protein B0H15DRAFT_955656 [Mycena belliae]